MRSSNKLIIYHDNNSVFTDFSEQAFDFAHDQFSLILLATTGYFYFGYYKPINQIYIDFSVANTNALILTGEYYNSRTSTWAVLDGFHDETKGFSRSGFINWDRNQEDQTDENIINGKELYWQRISASVDTSAMTINGVNLIFATDIDIDNEFPGALAKLLPEGESTFIKFHIAVRNEIVQRIRNSGKRKFKNLTKRNNRLSDIIIYENIQPWDILDIGEIRTAATYLALSKIFNYLSDKPDDFYAEKGKFYNQSSEQAFKLFWLSIDESDDGIASSTEATSAFSRHMFR